MTEKQGDTTTTESHCARPASSQIIDELLVDDLQIAAEEIAPRFLATMPSAYFHGTDQEMRLSHLKAVIAAEASGVSLTIGVIDRATEAVTLAIDTVKKTGHELTLWLVKSYLPAVLLETVGVRFFERIPAANLTRVIATVRASHIVYREGLDWFEQIPDEAIATLAVRYLQEEVAISQRVDQVTQSDLPDRERIAELLRAGGVAAALRNTVVSA